jgi:hypothetical protein
MNSDARQALIDAVDGDLAAVRVLESLSRAEVETLASDVELVLSARVLAQVIADYDAGVALKHDVQRWAEFVRWGHLPGPNGPRISDVDIDFEIEAEDAIVEALARLDELGDIIDGELRPGEAAQLRQALLAHAAS